MSFLARASKTALIVFIMFAVAIPLRILFRTSTASASSIFYHPQFCAGGWENPRNGAGDLQLDYDSLESSYNTGNSAYLESSIASQIFCGFFPVEEKVEPPEQVSINFNWVMKYGESVLSPATNNTPFESSGPIEDTNIDNSEEVVPVPAPEIAPEPDLTPTPTPEPEPSPEAPLTPADPVVSSWLKFLVKTAHAQEVSSEDFLSVSYSLDGVRWSTVGRVNANNWKNFSANIPLNSWQDLKDIQIMINVLPSMGVKPDIYMDGMSLSIEYDRPISETVVESVDDVTATVLSALDAATETILEIFIPNEEEAIIPEVVKEPVIIKEKKLTFSKGEGSTPTTRALPWYSAEFRNLVVKSGQNNNAPQVRISEDGKSAVVSGNCEAEYFVILLFKQADDYIERQGSFASNFADKCSDGKYSYDLKSISTDVDDGDYFLLVASEDETNPWVPAAALVPISISSIIEERIITE